MFSSSDASTSHHFCEDCNIRVYGDLAWNQHLESRGHRRRKKFEDSFTIDAKDMFIDENAPTAKLLADARSLIGLEYIVEDRTNEEIKCMLCRVLLKDKITIVDHVKTYKHKLNYLEKISPETIADAQKALTKSDLTQFVNCNCDDFLKQYGCQKIRIYEAGYSEKRQKKLAELRTNSVQEPDNIVDKTITRLPIDDASLDELDEMPKNALVMQTLLNANVTEFAAGEACQMNDLLKELKGPIVGLEYVAEYSDPKDIYDPGYFCTLCESVMTPKQLLVHVTKKAHKLAFLARDYPNYSSIVSFPGFTEERRCDLVDKYAIEAEKEKGRMLVCSRITLPEDCEFLFQYHAKRSKPAPSDVQEQWSLQAEEERQMQLRINDEYNQLQAKRQHLIASQVSTPFSAHQAPSAPPSVTPSLYLPNIANIGLLFPLPNMQLPPPTLPNLLLPPPALIIPPLTLSQTTPAVSQSVSVKASQPRKPNLIYSEQKEARERSKQKSDSASTCGYVIPPFAVKNVKNEWFSDRAISLDYHAQRFSEADYVSLRNSGAKSDPYGDWSPFLMRRLQDQFSFESDNLAWLQEQFVRWRTPLYQPLEMVDLRPLEDEVEVAVLEVLVGQTLKPTRSIKDRKLYAYPITPVSNKSLDRKIAKKEPTTIFDYQHSSSPADKIDLTRSSKPKSLSMEKHESRFRKRKASDSEEEINSSATEENNVDNAKKKTPKSNNSVITPPENDAFNAVREKAILELSQKILKIAQETKDSNAIVQLLLSYSNAEKILYNLATKDQQAINDVVALIRCTSTKEMPFDLLLAWKTKFDHYSTL